MSKREGSLEAPTRHPIAWQRADYYDEARLAHELERVFDICHGCRRCVNLCNAFPTLFDLIDEGSTGELDGVDKKDYVKVVDQCYLCDLCFMTKCPYVPPHPWNVDFPHLMLRAKAVKFRKGEVRLRDKVLTSTDALGKLAAIPVVAQTVNAANRNGAARRVLQSVLGVDKRRELPPYAPTRFRRAAEPRAEWAVRDGERTPGKVAIFSTCYINYNEPGIGHDLVAVLAHNEIPAVLARQEACCGMPKLELGDLEGVRRLKDVNIPQLAALARDGYAILAAVPSCALMFKQELPLLFPGDADIIAVADAMFDPFEYFMLRHRDGLLKTDFKQPLGKVSYHIPCHSRVQNIGQKTRETLQLVPGTEVTTVERCAGHDGTWGVKEEYFEQSMKIGRPVFRQMAQGAPDYISSDCPIAARHIRQGIRDGGKELEAEKAHPLTLLRRAYGL
ncbi:heterodisulfide reductase-related iron-sulfur binding cluster [Aromatoleum evansii]|uniref:heterodisulfide reductase-related iron-sulfur binding cluster n=1 Tax=Aromatoleum evansii TaxID=59406 RepID=UPI00145C3D93|nr:heterodisulfide reductase-related iron-sulfur binding cluster [Aromatoleum evansii]NMG29723.1 Fe-S oxidoreductase [Aromatoleum evansii]